MTARLPTVGGDSGSPPNDWGSILNDYLQQSLASDGKLVTSTTNSYTGLPNTNLATTGQPGLLQMAGDLGGTSAAAPKVVGLQGRSVDSSSPSDGNVLTWNNTSSKWVAQAPISGVTGPGSSTDNAITRWDGTGGTTVQNSTVTVSDTGVVAGASISNSTNTLTIGTDQSFSSHKITSLAAGTASTDAVNYSQLYTPRVTSITSSATPGINISTTDVYNITALATDITSMTSGLTGGTANDGQKLLIRIKDNGTIRNITWGTSFTSSGVATLLAATVAGKQHTIGLIYSSATSKWICLAVDATGY